MAANLFYLPFRPAISTNSLVISGATLTFYQTGTTTKLPIYTTSALTTELDNPVSANAAGVWPSIYLDDTKTYRVILKDADGAVLNDADPYLASIADDLTDELQAIADNVADNAALAEASANASTIDADRAESARDIAQAAIGVDYADATDALAGAANGDKFTYWAGSEIVFSTKTAGVLVELAGPWIGADKVGAADGHSGSWFTTVQEFIDAVSGELVTVGQWSGDLVAAVADIGTARTTLIVNEPVTLATTLTIPANITLRRENTGLITITGSARLFVNGPVQADRLQQFFECSLFTNAITASIDANALVITAVASNTVAPGQIVTGAGLRDGMQIFQEYGTTGVGTYALNGYNGIIASQAMTIVSSPVIFGEGTVEKVYPAWFGAAKDGVTDCTLASRLSVYSQPWGGTVRFPAGGYVVTGTTVLHPGITIEGDGVNNDYSGSPPPSLSAMATIFVTADNVSAFVISERCNQVNIRDLVFSTKNPPYLSGGDYAPYGTNRRAIRYEGHAPQGIFGGAIDACQFFGFASAILANDTWAGVGDGVGAPGTYWNGTASVTYYDWQINPLKISNCQFVGNAYGVLINSNNCDAWLVSDSVFVLPPNSSGVHLLRCGFIKLDNCFAFAGNLTNTDFVNLIGNGAEALDNVTLDNCQAENCSHFLVFAPGSTNTTPPQINVRNSIHQISADVYLGSPCEYNSQNNHLMSYVYVDSANVRVNSINDKFEFLNYTSGPTWNIVNVSGDVDTINTYVPGRNPSSALGENAWFNGYAINNEPNVRTDDNYAITAKDVTVVIDRASSTNVVLPFGYLFPGRRIRVVTRQAQAVLSSQSNITPITGGAATNAILAGTAGKWADLESDGTYWVVTAGN